MRAQIYMGLATFFGAWICTAGTRFIVAQSYWTLCIEAAASITWLVSLQLFKDWDDYRKLAPVIIITSLLGTGIGLTVPGT
jgi:hypothetical protein